MELVDQDAVRRALETLNGSVTNLFTTRQAELVLPPVPVEALRAAPQLASTAPREPHMPIPEQYSGEAGRCASFLLQCSLVFDLRPITYSSNRLRIAFNVNLLSGRTAKWATAVLENRTPASSSFPAFKAELKGVFDPRSRMARRPPRPCPFVRASAPSRTTPSISTSLWPGMAGMTLRSGVVLPGTR